MQVSFALFADAANLSQEGKLNILGVFDALQVGSLPTVHPRAHLVVHLKGTQMDVGPHTVTLRWVNPHGRELWSSTGELNVGDRKSTRLNSSHANISYAVFCLKKKKTPITLINHKT